MSDEMILAAVAGTEQSIYGLRWGEQTRLAVLDIDKNSKYHCELELENLQAILAAVELSGTLYRSSESGGWHLYLFFDNWVNTAEVNETLGSWLRAKGYEIRGGVLEVFPSGMGLRLPLQPGFAWLDYQGKLIRAREELNGDEAIASFLCDLEQNKRNWSEAKSRIQSQLEARDRAAGGDALAHRKAIDTEGFDGLFNYRLIPEKYEKGRDYWRTGLTAKSQRHDAVLAIEHYLWHGDKLAGLPALPGEANDETRYRVILAWLEERHNGFCNHINRGRWHKVKAHIKRACLWRRPSGQPRIGTPYPFTENSIDVLIARSKATGRTWTMDDLKKGNEGREQEAREKIGAALQLLTDQGRRVSCRQLMRLSGCSYHTVRRHMDIWSISPVVSLPRAAGDQSPFLALDPSISCSSLSGSKFEKEFDHSSEGESNNLALCLLSYADRLVATARDCDGMESSGDVASPSLPEPSTGSKHWLLGLSRSTCGLNGFLPSLAVPALGPPHLNPRELFSKGSGLVMLRDGRSGEGDRDSHVCYTDATVSGIKEILGATCREGALLSFWAESKDKKTVPDTTNFKFLTTGLRGSCPGFSDEFSLIEKGSKQKEQNAPVASRSAQLFVIPQTYWREKKQTRRADRAQITSAGSEIMRAPLTVTSTTCYRAARIPLTGSVCSVLLRLADLSSRESQAELEPAYGLLCEPFGQSCPTSLFWRQRWTTPNAPRGYRLQPSAYVDVRGPPA